MIATQEIRPILTFQLINPLQVNKLFYIEQYQTLELIATCDHYCRPPSYFQKET